MILNLKKGCSVVALPTLELLIEVFNRDVIPRVPEKGSLGASGDLIPQAHVALAIIGRGQVFFGDNGEALPSKSVLRDCGLQPVELEAGEAIALLNGTSLMTSYLAFLVFHADILIEAADRAAAWTSAILGCDSQSYDGEVHSLRPHPGQVITALRLKNILGDRNPRRGSASLQDAYSLRCVPQVHGAFREALFRAREVVNIEINSFGGNPLVLFDAGKPRIVQGSGNFHGQILAQTADSLALALCSLAGISERRMERLLNGKVSGMPPFLAKEGGLNTGLMIAQYAAAALVSENKTLAHPASVDSIPVSAGQEDFVSMGAWAVRKAWEILKNTEYVIAIETVCASQASDPREDRVFSEEIETARQLIHRGGFPDSEAGS
jgi:histidine ammonia-lyase